ncbi:MAG: glutamine synthetase family protein [Hyphomicrobiales bacterium]
MTDWAAARDVAYLCWTDYVGLVRTRGVPAADLLARMAKGLGWAVAGQALTPFDDIADNIWGPMMEVRQTPVPETEVRLDLWPGVPPFHVVLCDSNTSDGKSWECCVRGFMKHALADFEAETGLRFAGAFEHEFLLEGPHLPPIPCFTLEAMRAVAPFTGELSAALTAAGLKPETIEPEYGVNQYEISTRPAIGAAAADRAVLTREVIREVARRNGLRAIFTPKPMPKAIGNGAHMHFSFVDHDGHNAAFDPAGEAGAAKVAQHFIAGVVRYMPQMCALLAGSPVSYYRLGPHHWSCGYASFGVQNREAAVRICPSPDPSPEKQRSGFNMEVRPPDATVSPYMIVGAVVRAGLEGIRAKLPLPPAIDRDPSELSAEAMQRLGVVPLPASLGEALDRLETDRTVAGWMSPTMLQSYVAVKRKEIALMEGLSDEEVCARYRAVY